MTTITLTALLTLLFFALWLGCEYAERKSKRWGGDRNLLRLGGACLLASSVSLALFINGLVEWLT